MATARRRFDRKNLNPVFHKRDKSEDDRELSRALIKQARKSGILNLSGRALSSVPEKVWNLNSPDKEELQVDIDLNSTKDEDAWWNQKPLSNLDLSSNTLTKLAPDVGNLYSLTVLNLHDNALTSIPAEIGNLEKLTKLNLSHNKLTQLPNDFFKLRELKYLNLSHNAFEEMPSELSDLYMLEVLDTSYNKINSLPGGIGFLVRLTQLILSYNKLKTLPNDIVNLRSLQKLDLVHNDLENLPPIMGELRKLECLYAQHNDIQELPDFQGCESLKELHISNNFIKEIPRDFCEHLPHLKILDLRDNKIEKVPDEIAMLQSLIRLDISNNSVSSLPTSLSTLAHLVSLQLEGNPIRSIRRDIIQCGTTRVLKTLRDRSLVEEKADQKNIAIIGENEATFPDRYRMRKSRSLSLTARSLTEVPEEVFLDAKSESVTLIDLSKNKLKHLPDGIQHLANIANELIIAHNLLVDVPIFLSQFDKIARIDISQNALTSLPEEFGCLISLRELNIANNKFQEIPRCVYELRGLEILLARDNQIKEIDATTAGLGALRRLAILDLANNSISQVPPILGKLTHITSLDLIGNCFRQPRHQILEKGTEAIMSYLRDRIPTN